MNSLPIPSGVAHVSLKLRHSSDFGASHPHLVEPDLFQAIVTREKEIDGRLVPQVEYIVEYIVESLDERVVRRALKRAGYPSTKSAVPVVR